MFLSEPGGNPTIIEQPWNIRLANAIRRGCQIYPKQLFIGEGPLVYTEDAACALQAAYRVGFGWNNDDPNQLMHCPEQSCAEAHRMIAVNIIIGFHLNDRHHWSRERIADWLSHCKENA